MRVSDCAGKMILYVGEGVVYRDTVAIRIAATNFYSSHRDAAIRYL